MQKDLHRQNLLFNLPKSIGWLLLLFFAFTGTKALADVITPFSGTLASSPSFVRPKTISSSYTVQARAGDFVAGSGSYNYVSFQAKPSTSGSYTLTVTGATMTDDDTFLLVYKDSFDPANPLNNLIAGNDDISSNNYYSSINGLNLDASTTYYLVLTSYTPGVTGTVNFQGSGPGSLAVSGGGSTPASTDATLSDLSLSAGTLNPAFGSGTTSYTASVASSVSTITVTPTVNESHATITVNGTAVASGSASGNINLNVGNNTITTVVTAQDGSTTKTYTITVNRAKFIQTITFNTLAGKTYGDADFDPGATSTNNSIAVTYSSDNTAVATIVSGKVHIVGKGTANIKASQAGDATYNAATDQIQQLTVAAKAITVTPAVKSKTYGTVDPVFTYTITTGTALVGSDVFTGALTRDAGENVTTYAIKQGTLALSSNYALTVVTGVLFTISKATLTATPDNTSKAYGAALPAFTVSYTGFAFTDNSSVVTTAPTISTTATQSSPVTTYPITATGAAAANYTFTYQPGILTVNPVPLTITANNQSKTYGAANPTLTASGSGFVNGDDITKLTTQPTVTTTATVSSPVNTYPITATGAASVNYTITYAPGTLTVNKADLRVTAINNSRNYGLANPTLNVSYNGFVNGDDATKLTTAPVANTVAAINSAPGTYAITVAGGVSANYNFIYVPGTFTVIPLTIADLYSLSLSKGTLSPSFSTGTLTYTSGVDYTVDNVTVNAGFHATATATVNGSATGNGSPSFPVALRTGNNTINIVVTAQDGITVKTYTINIYKALPPEAMSATNILTPNGDGRNDTWVIKDIDYYPNNTVTVYDRGGRVVYSKTRYTNDWNGTLRGNPLAEGTYYFVINLDPTIQPVKGFITILKAR